MTTKTRRPLAAKKPLPMLHFPANQESSRRRVMLAAADAREAVQRSLKIECLEAANFRAHVSAAPLKPCQSTTPAASICYFRAHVSAAPLKLVEKAKWAFFHYGYFRAHVSAAPLKLSKRHPAPHAAVSDFRAHVSAAPLKRREPGQRRHGDRIISALT